MMRRRAGGSFAIRFYLEAVQPIYTSMWKMTLLILSIPRAAFPQS